MLLFYTFSLRLCGLCCTKMLHAEKATDTLFWDVPEPPLSGIAGRCEMELHFGICFLI